MSDNPNIHTRILPTYVLASPLEVVCDHACSRACVCLMFYMYTVYAFFRGGVELDNVRQKFEFRYLGGFQKNEYFLGWGHQGFLYFFKSPLNRN